MRLRSLHRAGVDVGLVVLTGAAALAILHAAPSIVALRSVLGLPFLLVGVGYVIVRAVYAAAPPEGLSTLVLAIALSIAAMILSALALHVLGIAFTGSALLTFEVLLCLPVGLIAVLGGRTAPPGPELRIARPPASALGIGGAVLLACGVLAGGIAWLNRPLPNSAVAGYSTVWAVRGSGATIVAGVGNSQLHPMTYRIEVDPSVGPSQSTSVTLEPGQRWTHGYQLTGPARQPVTVRLFRADQPAAAYREVQLAP